MTELEAIKILESKFDKLCGDYRYQNAEKLDFEDALYAAISALRTQQAQQNGGWISVKDGLPDRDTRVLTTFVSNKGSTGIEDCFYSGMRNRFVLYHTFEEVPDNITITHWMPLPEPPKEDAE